MIKLKSRKQKQIDNSIEEYKAWLFLTFKRLIGVMFIDFVKFSLDFNNEDNENNVGAGAVFSIKYQPEYHSAVIQVFPLAYRVYCENQNNLVDAMIHELSHMHTTPLTNVAQARYTTENELTRVCENLTEVLAKYISEFVKL